jgi:hypothetical protein
VSITSDATIKRKTGSKLDIVSDLSGSSSRIRGFTDRL